jgi:hypothetical protein
MGPKWAPFVSRNQLFLPLTFKNPSGTVCSFKEIPMPIKEIITFAFGGASFFLVDFAA